jgi:hypothetical protein
MPKRTMSTFRLAEWVTVFPDDAPIAQEWQQQLARCVADHRH